MTKLPVVVAALLSATTFLLTGCGKTPPPEFRKNIVAIAAKDLTEEHEEQIGDILVAMFGTPDEPYAPLETGLNLQKILMAAGPVRSDKTGAKHGLFREHCAHCHGVTGDGMGPTAAFLKPYPRDYRQGLYKFKSTSSNYPPTHDDLMRIVNEGVTGTAMPSFKLLPKDQVEALVEYVKYLSFRGQMELALINAAGDFEGKEIPQTHQFLIGDMLTGESEDYPEPGPLTKWNKAVSQVTKITPPPANFGSRESIAAGKELFHSSRGGCTKCHGPTELGDGQKVLDLWNNDIEKLQKKVTDGFASLDRPDPDFEKLDGEARDKAEEEREDRRRQYALLGKALEDGALPLRISDPRNLRQGIFRGGREPFELFYRLHNGIFAAQMPGIAPQVANDDIWHIIDYVRALPYEPGSQYAPEPRATPRDRP